ncbi:MAG TPA: DUF4384 domain-containing protein [Blastocatellia bacterium]|nr:DUF4384 domain-containing protein [Blastocatellia bacterium]
MSVRSKRLLVALIVSAGLVAPVVELRRVEAGPDNPYVWDEPVKVKRVAKPRRKPAATPQKTEKAPLLTLKWQALRRGDGNTMDRIDASQPVKVGDQLKLSVTPNQDGFLYIIHQSTTLGGKVVDQPHLIFPDPRINNGANAVKKDQRYVVPASCAEYDDPNDCWWEITPPDGKEAFTVVFSRDEITTLSDKEAGSWIEQNVIDEIKATSRAEDLKRTNRIKVNALKGEESDGVYVQNSNPDDNEEIFDTIELSHVSDQPEDAGMRARALFIKKRSDAMRVIVLKDDVPVDPSRDFRQGEEIQVKFRSNFDGYAYVVNVTPGGRKRLLFPCARLRNNRITVGMENVLPSATHGFVFDAEAGTETLMVVMSRTPVAELDAALAACCTSTTQDCCDRFVCDLNDVTSRAVDQLTGGAPSQVQGIAPPPQSEASAGARTRGIILAPGRDKNKAETFVAVEDKEGGRLQSGKVAVFYVRLKHV